MYGQLRMPYRKRRAPEPLPKATAHGRAALPQRPGCATEAGEWTVEPVEVEVGDGRALLKEKRAPSLDRQGFAFLEHSTALAVEDFTDIDVVCERYFPEVEEIIRQQIPGVSRVLIFDHAVRAGGQLRNEDSQANPYASVVHSDATPRSLHTRAKDQILGTNETEVKYGRYPSCWGEVRPSREWQRRLFRAESEDHDSPEGEGGDHIIVNVWRPIQETPVMQYPLALLDAESIEQADVHPSFLQTYDNKPGGQAGAVDRQETESKVKDLDGNGVSIREGEVLSPLYDPNHRWYIFPQITMDEVLLLKIFDSRRDGRARFSCHAAAFDPKGDPKAHRKSIEVRCLVILEPSARL